MDTSEDRQTAQTPLPPLWAGEVPSFVPARRPADPLFDSIEARFQAFHESNPWVYEALVRLARDLKSHGHDRVGIKMLFEVLRWAWSRDTESIDGFKLNNSFTALYARTIMAQEEDLSDIFQTRRRPSTIRDAA